MKELAPSCQLVVRPKFSSHNNIMIFLNKLTGLLNYGCLGFLKYLFLDNYGGGGISGFWEGYPRASAPPPPLV